MWFRSLFRYKNFPNTIAYIFSLAIVVKVCNMYSVYMHMGWMSYWIYGSLWTFFFVLYSWIETLSLSHTFTKRYYIAASESLWEAWHCEAVVNFRFCLNFRIILFFMALFSTIVVKYATPHHITLIHICHFNIIVVIMLCFFTNGTHNNAKSFTQYVLNGIIKPLRLTLKRLWQKLLVYQTKWEKFKSEKKRQPKILYS